MATTSSSHLSIVFASDSGTARRFAHDAGRDATEKGYSNDVWDIEEFNHETDLAKQKIVLFFLATRGEGDPTWSAKAFQKWLMNSDRSRSCMDGVKFAVFALGSKNYEFFCGFGKRIDKRMSELGAERIFDLQLGDDSERGRIRKDFDMWKPKFWEMFESRFPPDTARPTAGAVVQCPFVVKYPKNVECLPLVDRMNSLKHHPAQHKHKIAKVTKIRELITRDKFDQSTKHIELDISESGISSYTAGQNIGLQPRNDKSLVRRIMRRLELDPKTVFTVERTSADHEHMDLPVPVPCTVEDAFRWHIDICTPPDESFFHFLSEHAQSNVDKMKLKYMASDAGKAEYTQEIVEAQRNVVDVLEMYPSVKITFAEFLAESSPLMTRYYTISSCGKMNPTSMHLTVGVLKEEKEAGRIVKGVASNYLAKRKPGNEVCIFMYPGMELPKKVEKPLIMIGAGTGIAPFRGFIQSAIWHQEHHDKDTSTWTLFFGFRHSEVDFLYKDFLYSAVICSSLGSMHEAKSRETDEKVYVQHLVKKEAKQLWKLIYKKKASVYICGSQAMGKAVHDEIRAMAKKYGKMGASEAKEYVSKMVTKKRLVSELWGGR